MSEIHRREPLLRPAPDLAGSRVSPKGHIEADDPRIYVHGAALAEAIAWSRCDTSRELGGFLVGVYGRDARGPYTFASEWRPASHCREQAGSIAFTHATWEALHRELAARHGPAWDRELAVVGWHHTHPGYGLFLSQHDLFIHRNFFDAPWQIALVVDPVADALAIFAWHGDEVRDTGFHVVEG